MVGRARSVALALLPFAAALAVGCDWDWFDHHGGGGKWKKEHHVKVVLVAVPAVQKMPMKTVTFNGVITIDKAMDVTYTFVRSDGSPSMSVTQNFPTPGSHAVSKTHTFPGPTSGWWKLKVISPETVETPPATYVINP